jgi:hypothetical protein
MPVVRCISSIVFAIAALLIRSVDEFSPCYWFCFLSRLVSSRFHADSEVLINPVSVDRFRFPYSY